MNLIIVSFLTQIYFLGVGLLTGWLARDIKIDLGKWEAVPKKKRLKLMIVILLWPVSTLIAWILEAVS